MVTQTKARILEMAGRNGRVRPVEVVKALGISQAAVQRQLKKLVETGKLVKKGVMPKIYYEITAEVGVSIGEGGLIDRDFVEKNYLYITPDGRIIPGWQGYCEWVKKIGEEERLEKLAEEYKLTRVMANKFINSNGWIEALDKMKSTFNEVWLEGVFYRDFYSLPKFGKTKLGQLVLYAKQSQNLDLISQVANEVRGTVLALCDFLGIEAIGFIPHSVPRKIQFLGELAKQLNLNLPKIDLKKSYEQIVVPQKTLPSLEERVENAKKTIVLWSLGKKYKRVLLIDDALGSGATMNETAKKLKETGVAERVFGFAVVGSMKGFEVIREV